ncbi:hypothetical protein T4D_11640 [Trichinella pseudospiralis]|uniref:Uncharacterized protein n=1 Tax=Trichinella pseudospiralis TaxID=6337 RepID=A0A0V1DJJ2_TRIPS|nr:hypothetical protein T4D_11640 [Trichinella pseudospiralis]
MRKFRNFRENAFSLKVHVMGINRSETVREVQ